MTMTPGSGSERVCVHYRCKQMLYERAAAPVPASSASDTTVSWCDRTQTCRGPDDAIVEVRACRGGRPCYEDIPAGSRPAP